MSSVILPIADLPPSKSNGLGRRALLGLALVTTLTTAGAWLMHAGIDPVEELDLAHLPPVRHELVVDLKSWRHVRAAEPGLVVAPTDDLVVVDPRAVTGQQTTGGAIAALKVREGGSRRLVIAALSISTSNPSELYGSEDGAVERLMTMGFDGVLMTLADGGRAVHEPPEVEARRIELIGAISARVKVRNPDALVGLEGAARLIESRRVRAAVDFVAVEHLLYEPAGRPRLAQDVAAHMKVLRKAQLDGLLVLVSERLGSADAKTAARRTLESYGFIAEAKLRDGVAHSKAD